MLFTFLNWRDLKKWLHYSNVLLWCSEMSLMKNFCWLMTDFLSNHKTVAKTGKLTLYDVSSSGMRIYSGFLVCWLSVYLFRLRQISCLLFSFLHCLSVCLCFLSLPFSIILFTLATNQAHNYLPFSLNAWQERESI